MNKRAIRDRLRLIGALLFSPIYLIHILLTFIGGGKLAIGDAIRMAERLNIKIHGRLAVLYFLHNNEYFRSLFYHRIGPIASLLISWWRPGCSTFTISYTTKIGKNVFIAHPYSTIINAESIGDNFSCIHCTTLGAKNNGRPVIGNNVSLGAHVCIIGNVYIGDNVTVGAGSVVVKDLPDNCIAVGNPAKPIKFINNI